MRFIEKIKASPHYPQLKNSLEYYHCRRAFIKSLIPVGIFLIPAIVLLIVGAGESDFFGSAVMFCLASLGWIGFSIYRAQQWLSIFSHMEDYQYFSVTLTKPIVHHSRFSHSISYSLTFPNLAGQIITKETTAMFHNEQYPRLQDFNSKQVQVAYNEETDRLIVLYKIQ